jgi:pteridine reductase
MELTGKTAIVTGATGNLGCEIAVGLAAAGCDVICCYHEGDARMMPVIERIRKHGRKGLAIKSDLCGQGAADKCVSEAWTVAAKAGLGPVRVLVNSASIFERTPIGTIDRAAAMLMMELDLVAPILLTQAFARMVRQEAGKDLPAGKIINLTDAGGEKVWRQYAVYCAAKVGLAAATRAMARELAPLITVNAVAPGLVTWPSDMDDAARERQLGFIPAGRIGTPHEVVSAIVFVLQNDYVTGQVINVDGGRTL